MPTRHLLRDTPLRCLRVIGLEALLGLATAALLGAQQPTEARAPAVALPFDSMTVHALLNEAILEVQRAPEPERAGLLAAITRQQITVRDFDGAMRTLLMDGDATPDEAARQLGRPVLLAGLDRAGLARRLACGLREAGRAEDALAFLRRLPPSEARDWEIAHEASLMARAASAWRDGRQVAHDDAVQRWRVALSIAREITWPEARLDALLAIATAIPDTSIGLPVLRETYDEARRAQLVDADRQRSRDAMLAPIAFRVGRLDDMRALYAGLSNAEDLLYVTASIASWPDASALVRELLPRTLAAGLDIRDARARDDYLMRLGGAVERSFGIAGAYEAVPQFPTLRARAYRQKAEEDSAKQTSSYPADRAMLALERRDFAEVRRQTVRLPRGAQRAELWTELAEELDLHHPDTARTYLLLARASLSVGRVDSRMRDYLLSRIARAQLALGDHVTGIATLNLITDPDAAWSAIVNWGYSTRSGLTARRLRAFADRMRDPRVRDAVLLRVITAYLSGSRASAADAAWARALADSIRTPQRRLEARIHVAREALSRGDSAYAKAQLIALLNDPADQALPMHWNRRDILVPLVMAGGWTEAAKWARSAEGGSARARRLMGLAGVLDAQLDGRRPAYYDFHSNALSPCRDDF